MPEAKDNQPRRKRTIVVPVLAAMAGASIAAVALLFIIYLNLLVQTIRLLSGIPSVIALFGIILLGLAALTTLIGVGSSYRRHLDSRKVLARFFLISGVQGILLFASELFRRWLLSLIGPTTGEAMLGFWNDAALVAGLVVGAVGLVAGALFRRRYRSTVYRR
ncbi:MAG: hypothetical protein ACOCVK_00470 [bacterium]